jgi:hypothetical protein
MEKFIFILIICATLGCQSTNRKTQKSNTANSPIPRQTESSNLEAGIYEPTKLPLETTTDLQDRYFKEDDSTFLGFEKILIDVSFGESIGYVVFAQNNQFKVALIEWQKGFKVIGIATLASTISTGEFIQGLYPSNRWKFKTFGRIELTKTNSVRTLQAWQINDKDKSIEEINPLTVDFTESYNTETE